MFQLAFLRRSTSASGLGTPTCTKLFFSAPPSVPEMPAALSYGCNLSETVQGNEAYSKLHFQQEGYLDLSDDEDRELLESIDLGPSEEDALQGIENELSKWVLQEGIGPQKDRDVNYCRERSTRVHDLLSQSGGMHGPCAVASGAPNSSDLHSEVNAGVLIGKASDEGVNSMITDSEENLRRRHSSRRRSSLLLSPVQ
jgi:hypothetical protein